jgi:hypothetical protein
MTPEVAMIATGNLTALNVHEMPTGRAIETGTEKGRHRLLVPVPLLRLVDPRSCPCTSAQQGPIHLQVDAIR